MKYNTQLIKFIVLLAGINFIACGPTKTVSLSITQPAEITLPSEAKTILLVDRTKFGNGFVNVLEGLLTGEMPTDDRVAAQEALVSLKNKLAVSPRFGVKLFPERMIGNSISSAFPEALTWPDVERLCSTNSCDLVVALEIFDTDFIVTNGTRVKKKTEGEGAKKREVEYTEYYAEGVGNIKMGFRAYYPKTKSIVDQQLVSENNRWEATGTNATDAAALLISRSEANRSLATAVGRNYAYKISPMPVTISRSFYKKSKHAAGVEVGSRFADVNKWENAIDVWKGAVPNAPVKDAGRLSYNIAVGYEVLGEYGTALTWAQDAYTRYGNNLARQYVQELEARIREERLLNKQLSK